MGGVWGGNTVKSHGAQRVTTHISAAQRVECEDPGDRCERPRGVAGIGLRSSRVTNIMPPPTDRRGEVLA